MIELNTNTELDQIGHSYNKMLKNIENLLAEIKEQEGVLRRTELNMLLAQINPHFLYNTLDTIYMLARINGEETTMKMIDAMVDEDSAIVSIYYGADETEEHAQEIGKMIEEKYPDVEVEINCGGQPIYYFVISVE